MPRLILRSFQSPGDVGNALISNVWRDAAGNVIKDQPAGSRKFTKRVFDGLNRGTIAYVGYDLDESDYDEVGDVDGDTILEQTELTFDDANNAILTTRRQRYHNATGTGSLNGPSGTQPKARVMYMASWPDAMGRTQAAADYGTNGGTALSRPDTIPARSDTVLVSSALYDSAGNATRQKNAKGIDTCLTFDAMVRQVQQVLNCRMVSSSSSSSSSSYGSSSSSSGASCGPSADENVTVATSFNADGQVDALTALNSSTGSQTTQFVFGTTLDDSDIASSLLKRKEIYPDSVDEDDAIALTYNRQGDVTSKTDQNGTVHVYDRDKLARIIHDRITTLGTGIDGAIRRLSYLFEVRGMLQKVTSWNGETVGSGSIVNEVLFTYNDFRQIQRDYQSHGAAVNTSTTPFVEYQYANGLDNTTRPTKLVFPDGRELNYSYGSSDSMADALSRVAALIVDDGTTHLADYSYLGLSTFVEVDYTEPEIKFTLVGTAGGNDPDTGDIYRGFDRFTRIKDSYWRNYGNSTDADRIKYGYDRVGSRTYRENTVATANGKHFDELYEMDLVDRLKRMERGELTSLKDEIVLKNFAQCWSLDETGNWQFFCEDSDGNGLCDVKQIRIANRVNEILNIDTLTGPFWAVPAYDRAGNMTTVPNPADPTSWFTAVYDAWNRLIRL